jgi:hypothetical protein
MKFHRSIFTLVMIACLMLGGLAAKASSNDSENRHVKVANEASSPILHLYISNVDEENWGPDQLGDYAIIGYDRYRIINMDDGTGHCLFDIKAVLSDGRYAVRRNFNVCTMNSWTVYN